jgi:histidinol-phosphatase
MDADLAFAFRLADRADSIALPRFRAADLRVDTKPDLTPVTDADRAVERAVRELVAAERPGEGVLGEEQGDDGGEGDARWIVDPIDGTRNFSRGLPVWATLLALERGGELVLGVVSAPALGHRWWAVRGRGAFRDGEPIAVSRVARLEDAVVSYTEPQHAGVLRAWHERGLGDFWQHVLVAEGAVDVAVDSPLSPWDWAAVQVVVEEAGGAVTAGDGEPPREAIAIVTSNGLLHAQALALL